MSRFPGLRELAAFVAQPPPSPDVQGAFDSFFRERLAREELAEQARQANMLEQGRNTRHAGDLGYNYAQLGETGAHNRATEADALRQRMQQRADAQQKVIAAIREAAAAGASPDVLRAMEAEAARQGVNLTERMAQDPAPPPKQLGAFAGLNMRAGLAPPPPPAAPPPRPTGQFDISADGQRLGTVDQPAIADTYKKQWDKASQAAIAGSRPIDRPARALAATQVGQLPALMADPEKALKAMNDTANPQLQNESAERRNATMAAAQSQRSAQGQGRLDQSLAYRVYKDTVDRTRREHDARGIQQRIMTAGRVQELVRQARGTDDLNGLFQDDEERKNALAGRLAIAENVKYVSGSRYSDADLRLQLQAGGVAAELQNALDRWTGGGGISEAQLQMIKKVAAEGVKTAKREQIALARHAAATILENPDILAIEGPQGAQLRAAQAEREITGIGGGPVGPSPARSGGADSASQSSSSSVTTRGLPLETYLDDGYSEEESP